MEDHNINQDKGVPACPRGTKINQIASRLLK